MASLKSDRLWWHIGMWIYPLKRLERNLSSQDLTQRHIFSNRANSDWRRRTESPLRSGEQLLCPNGLSTIPVIRKTLHFCDFPLRDTQALPKTVILRPQGWQNGRMHGRKGYRRMYG